MKTKDCEEIKMIPIDRVASDLGTPRRKILIHIQDGLLTGEKRDGDWVITPDSIETFKQNHQGKRAANKCTKGCVGTSSCVGCN